MREMIKVSVESLEGDLLDCLVACAINPDEKIFYNRPEGYTIRWVRKPPPFSTDWAKGGPLIDKYQLTLSPPTSPVHRNGGPHSGWGRSGVWNACTWEKGFDGRRAVAHHETSALVAAMRAFVEFSLGASVEVPKELAT